MSTAKYPAPALPVPPPPVLGDGTGLGMAGGLSALGSVGSLVFLLSIARDHPAMLALSLLTALASAGMAVVQVTQWRRSWRARVRIPRQAYIDQLTALASAHRARTSSFANATHHGHHDARRPSGTHSASLSVVVGIHDDADGSSAIDPLADRVCARAYRQFLAERRASGYANASAGTPVELNLEEPARGGTGPHGVIVGPTGSGKSELVRTVVGHLLATNSPEKIAFLFVDFKGGATFAPFLRWPHIAGVVTNLENDLDLVDRMATALTAELKRRQAALRDAPSGGSSGTAGEPRLLIVIDEFAELLADRPEVLEILVQVARVGRSLGVHLLLVSQSPNDAERRGLDVNLGYRIDLQRFVGTLRGDELDVTFHTLPASIPVPLPVSGFDTPLHGCSTTETAGQMRPIWLPPLTDLAPQEVAGLGFIDRPDQQRYEPLEVADGQHVLVVGAPRSGTTTLARAIAHHLKDTGGGEVVLVDRWADNPGRWDELHHIASHGLAEGVRLVATARRYSELRASTRDLFGERFELRLNDPFDSEVSAKRAAKVPRLPGFGLTRDGHLFRGAAR